MLMHSAFRQELPPDTASKIEAYDYELLVN